jgi:hypothetical protein
MKTYGCMMYECERCGMQELFDLKEMQSMLSYK